MSAVVRDYKRRQRRSVDMERLRHFALGALVGIVLATAVTVYYMNGLHATPREKIDGPHPEPHRTAPPDPDAGATPEGSGSPKEKLEFYQMLPNFEVVVPEKDKVVKADAPGLVRVERPGVYVLQARSFRNEADADRLRAQLALQGIDAKVQRVQIDADVWHRVRIGPISNLDELNRLRRQLRALDLDALVIRVGD